MLAGGIATKGSGAPSHTAPAGTLYYRTNGVIYVNTDGAATWVAIAGALAASQATRTSYGTVLAMIAESPASPVVIAEVLDGCTHWGGVKFRGSAVDHPTTPTIAGMGSASVALNVGAADGDNDDGMGVLLTSTAAGHFYTSVSFAGNGFVRRRSLAAVFGKLNIPALATRREWMGAAVGGLGALLGSATPAVECMTLRHDGTDWRIYTHDGTNGSASAALVGAATGLWNALLLADKDAVYGRVWKPGGSADSGWVTKATNLPAMGTELGTFGFLFEPAAAGLTARWHEVKAKFR